MIFLSHESLDTAVKAVEAGELVVLPTKRWYMVCGNAQDEELCESIFIGKGRSKSKSLALVIPYPGPACDQFHMNARAKRLASAFWPGDLALILPWRDRANGDRHRLVGTPNALVATDPGILGEFAARSSVPIAATTANFSEHAADTFPGPAITPSEVQKFVEAARLDVAYCIDGGICPLAQHLTVVDCTGDGAAITRSGVVHDRAIHAAMTD